MHLRIQTRVLLLIATFAALFVVMLALHWGRERRQVLTSLREREAATYALLNGTLDLASRPLTIFVYNYTSSDEMRDFVETREEAWAAENIDAALKTFEAQAVWVYAKNLARVYSANTLHDSALTELPLASDQLDSLLAPGTSGRFFIPTASGPMEIHFAPLPPGSGEKRPSNPHGYLFVGRLWSPEYLRYLSMVTGAALRLDATADPEVASSHDARAFTVTTRIVLPAWNGRPLMVLAVVSEFPGMRKSYRELRYHSVASTTFVAAVVLALSLFLFRYVSNPLRRITASLAAQNPALIESVRSSKTEFAGLAVLIGEFFGQKEILQAEIEQRKQSEAALRESEKRFRDLADLLPLIIFETDESGRVTFLSRTAAELLRLEGESVPERLNVLELIAPADRARAEADMREALANRTPPGLIEYRGLRADGTTLDLAVDACPIIRDGQVCGIRGFAMDVSKSKAAVEALRQNRELLHTLIETAPLPICALDREGRVHEVWNPAAENMFGWKKSEVTGKFALTAPMVPEDVRERDRRDLTTLWEGQTLSEVEVTLRDREGNAVPVSCFGAPLRDSDGTVNGAVAILVDLSERRKMEQALRESEERFRNLSDTAPVLIWMAGVDRHCYYFNKTWLRFTGRPLQQEYGKGWMAGVHPDDLVLCVETYRSAFAARRPFSVEFRLRAASGEYRWVLDRGAPRFTADGAFAGYIGTCTDISDRRGTEEALRESEALLRAVFDGARDPIFVKDRDRKYLHANPATAHSYNRSLAELIGRSDDDLHEPEAAARIREDDLRVLAGEMVERETTATVGGATLTCSVIKVPFRGSGGQILGLVGVARDITCRKRAEESLREEKEKAQRYLDIVGTIVVAISPDETLSLINQAGCRLLEVRPEEIRGKNWFKNFLPERLRENVRKMFAQLMAGEVEPAEYAENAVLTRSGQERIVAWHNTVLRDKAGHITGTLSAGEDITERRSAEFAQRQAAPPSEGPQDAAAGRDAETPASISHHLETLFGEITDSLDRVRPGSVMPDHQDKWTA